MIYEFQGRAVTMPVVVRDANSIGATYLVRSEVARTLLPDPGLALAELLPGRALLSLACIQYVDNDLGDYGEVSLALFVRPRSAPAGLPYLGTLADLLRNRLGTYIFALPVNQSFTRDAGEGIWGFPKTVEQIEFTDQDGWRECRLTMGGMPVLTFAGPRSGQRTLPEQTMITYSRLHGALHQTRFTAGATEVGFGFGRSRLTLGSHPLANRLRALGLPRRPLLTMWMGHQRGTFQAPERV